MSKLSIVPVVSLLVLLLSAVGQCQQKKPCSSSQQQTDSSDEAFFEKCSSLAGPDWIKYGDHCYRHFEANQYWVPAMDHCKSFGGNLVSINNSFENSFVAKLTYCRSAWIGRYSVNVDRISQADNYRWTDGTPWRGYHEHDFSAIGSIHEPLIYARNLSWFNMVYHGKQSYVCKVPDPNRDRTCDCDFGWRQLGGYCYHMPNVEATYIEADYYCRGRNAHLTSVHTRQELRAMSLIDVNTPGCPLDTWIGLVKLNPCRYDFSTGASVCFRWSDRSGNHTSFPEWHAGSPIMDQTTNCVLLKDTGIKSAPCHTRARFVCKKAVRVTAN